MTTIPGAVDALASLWDTPRLLERIRTAEGLPDLSRRALAWGILGALSFGGALGSYGGDAAQAVAAAVKVPLLLLGTSVLCFPSLFVLQGLRAPAPMRFREAVAVQVLSLSAMAVVWGSFAPSLFFLVGSTHHYRLTQVLSLAVGTAGGVVGLWSFLRLHASLTGHERELPAYLLVYLPLFAMVGGQMAWVLRPFIGDPGLPFQLFRDSGGDMFTHVLGLAAR